MDGDSCLSAEYRLRAVAHTDGLDHTGDSYCHIALNSPRKFAVPWDDPVKRLICARAGCQNRRSVCSGENSRRGELSAGFPCFYPGGEDCDGTFPPLRCLANAGLHGDLVKAQDDACVRSARGAKHKHPQRRHAAADEAGAIYRLDSKPEYFQRLSGAVPRACVQGMERG